MTGHSVAHLEIGGHGNAMNDSLISQLSSRIDNGHSHDLLEIKGHGNVIRGESPPSMASTSDVYSGLIPRDNVVPELNDDGNGTQLDSKLDASFAVENDTMEATWDLDEADASQISERIDRSGIGRTRRVASDYVERSWFLGHEKAKSSTDAMWPGQSDDESDISFTSPRQGVRPAATSDSQGREDDRYGMPELSKELHMSNDTRHAATSDPEDHEDDRNGIPELSKELDMSNDSDGFVQKESLEVSRSSTRLHQRENGKERDRLPSQRVHLKTSVQTYHKEATSASFETNPLGVDEVLSDALSERAIEDLVESDHAEALSPTDGCLGEIHVLEDTVGQIKKLHNGLWETSSRSLDRLRHSQMMQKRVMEEAVTARRRAQSEVEKMRTEVIRQSTERDEMFRGYEQRITELESRIETVLVDRSDMEKIAEEAIAAAQDRLEKDVSQTHDALRRQEEANERTLASYNQVVESRSALSKELDSTRNSLNELRLSHVCRTRGHRRVVHSCTRIKIQFETRMLSQMLMLFMSELLLILCMPC